MLVELPVVDSTDGDFHEILEVIAKCNGNESSINRLEKGVYEIGHFSMNFMVKSPIDEWPELRETGWFSSYGVCDNYQQVLTQCPQLEEDPDREFVISVTPIHKSSQSEKDGWRWHKWGPYIGVHKPQKEYLYDEPVIEAVFVYHIYEILGERNETV